MLLQLPEHELLPEQLQILESLISEQYRHVSFPRAEIGLRGLEAAHGYLFENGLYGLLIGGIAKGFWRGEDIPTLNAHKDVDVLVLDPYASISPKFHLGIDWWLLQQQTRNEFYGKNGQDISLLFAVELDKSLFDYLSPGLLIPSAYMVSEMLVYEKIHGSDDVDNEILRALRHKSTQEFSNDPVQEIRKYNILDARYNQIKNIENAINIVERE